MRIVLLFSMMFMLTGCGEMRTGKNAEPTQITGKVSVAGKPVNDVMLNLLPAESGAQQVNFIVKKGEFSGSAVPGKYTYTFSETRNAAALKLIPEMYHSPASDRTVVVTAGTPIVIDLK